MANKDGSPLSVDDIDIKTTAASLGSCRSQNLADAMRSLGG